MAATIGWMFLLSALVQNPSPSSDVHVETVQPSAPAKKRQDPTRFARSLMDEAGDHPVGLDLSFEPVDGLSSASSALSAQVTVQAVSVSGGAVDSSQRLFEVTIHPGVGYVEKFLVAPAGGSVPRPLLVCFHKFGNSAYDILYNTKFFQEGISRGWHVVAPLGGSGVHFSSIESQVNTEQVLNWTKNHFPVDKTRVYAVGFSMGGGAAMNYAARHLDPDKLMIAAVMNHTGVVSLEDAYINEPGSQYIMDFWFGNGTPGSFDPWKMKRSSVISFNPVTLQVDTTSDLARNLMHVNTRTLYANGDPLGYLINANNLLHQHFANLGATFGQHALYVYPGTTHTWSTLNEKVTCDWLRTQRLVMPKTGNTLADHDGKYFYFTVTQDQANAFTPFAWQINNTANSLEVSQTANLHELAVDRALAGLSNSAVFTAVLATSDGLPDVIRLKAWNDLPYYVTRDGVATASWNYNASTGDLTLNEFDGSNAHTWRVVP